MVDYMLHITIYSLWLRFFVKFAVRTFKQTIAEREQACFGKV